MWLSEKPLETGCVSLGFFFVIELFGKLSEIACWNFSVDMVEDTLRRGYLHGKIICLKNHLMFIFRRVCFTVIL